MREQNVIHLHLNILYNTRVFLAKISSTVYANVRTDKADALRGERVEGRASNLSLLKEAGGEKREALAQVVVHLLRDTECARDRSEGLVVHDEVSEQKG